MNRIAPFAAAALLGGSGLLGGCAYNDTLGRNQLILAAPGGMEQQSEAAWQQLLQTQNPARTGASVERIRRVGDRLVQAAGLSSFGWDYAVFNSQSPNGCCQSNANSSPLAGVRAGEASPMRRASSNGPGRTSFGRCKFLC